MGFSDMFISYENFRNSWHLFVGGFIAVLLFILGIYTLVRQPQEQDGTNTMSDNTKGGIILLISLLIVPMIFYRYKVIGRQIQSAKNLLA